MQVANHLVYAVLEFGHLTLRVHGYGPGEVTFCHHGGYVGDGTNLGGQIGR
ncbi:hypothetical protein GALL_424520 [mine drainage metagenome]|uniref:Uncharacterized protein n=1 Tax=mine drainage metagenome TaxID=410659 RepID=A0A1J5QEE1_9ZZZZ